MFSRYVRPGWLRFIIAKVHILGCCCGASMAAEIEKLPATGPQPTVVSLAGKTNRPYRASFALLIAESRYIGRAKNGWTPLTEPVNDAHKLSKVLQSQGFEVTILSNATRSEIVDQLYKFSGNHGTEKDNRLLYFYSGHGHSDGDNGYIVPINAPLPEKDLKGFQEHAIPIRDFETLAHTLRSNHAIFIFDSCFSGAIFNTKGASQIPDQEGPVRLAYLTNGALRPARLFITAGGATETVPAKSVFLPLLLNALTGNDDVFRDGYVTGKQIGSFVAERVPSIARSQNPEYGPIRDAELSRGDIVFQYGAPSLKAPPATLLPKPSASLKSITYSVDLFFDYDKATMNPSSALVGDQLMSDLAKAQIKSIGIVGYADKKEQVSQAYGAKIGQRRAEAVKNYLVSKGWSGDFITTQGKFITEAKSEADSVRSRRATIEVEFTLK